MTKFVFALAITGVFAIPVSASLSTDAFAQQHQKRAKTQNLTGPMSPVDSRIFQSSSRYMRERHNPADGNGS